MKKINDFIIILIYLIVLILSWILIYPYVVPYDFIVFLFLMVGLAYITGQVRRKIEGEPEHKKRKKVIV